MCARAGAVRTRGPASTCRVEQTGVCGSPAEQPLIPPAGAALGLRLSPWNSRPRSAGLLQAQALSDSGGVSRATTGPFSLALAQQAAHLPRFLLDSPPPLEKDSGDRGAVVAIGSCRLTTTEVTWRASGKPAT